MCPSGQLGCNGWSGTLQESAEYTDHKSRIEDWSGGTQVTGPACANNQVQTTFNGQWLAMSIVYNPATGPQPSFTYPNTSMVAWLCQSDQEGTYNNSGPEAEIFYNQFTNASQLGNNFYQINAISGCKGTEGVGEGVPPQNWVTILEQNGLQPTGANAVGFEMSSNASASRCHKLHTP